MFLTAEFPSISSTTNEEFIAQENQYSVHNYHPLPVVLAKGEGVFLWDVEGKKYYDFLSAYSAVNQGHCHPEILSALVKQASTLSLTSRAFHNDKFSEFSRYITSYFGFDRVLPMNTGAEAVETALKICRKWAYQTKGIPENKAKIIVCKQNFHGRTISIVSMSTDPDSRREFGPFTPGFEIIPYNDIQALRSALNDPHVAGFLVEPIQGEAGVNVPDYGYLTDAFLACKEKNVLFMADEIQTGIARTGQLLACCYEGVKPDLLILGKALSGGMFPVSVVLGREEVMMCIQPGEHGSTYGGNPLGCAIAMAALDVVKNEKLAENAFRLGNLLRSGLEAIHSPLILTVRGKGLLNAIVIDESKGAKAWDICMKLMENGLLAKPTHGHIIRFAPPLIITETQIKDCLHIISKTLKAFE